MQNFFKYGVIGFSAGMTVLSIFEGFGGGWIGLLFGLVGIALFEGAMVYWTRLYESSREAQINVSQVCLWSTTFLSLMSTVVGIAIIATWGIEIRSQFPLGPIMIVLVGLGLAVNIIGFSAFANSDPVRRRQNLQRQIEAMKADMIHAGDLEVLKEARFAMEQRVAAQAPILGANLADDGIITVQTHARESIGIKVPPRQIQPPANQARQNQQAQTQQFAATAKPEPKVEQWDPTSDVELPLKEEKAPNPPAASKGPHPQRK